MTVNMNEIKTILASLSWNRPVHEQASAIKQLHKYKDEVVNNLITSTGKYQWINAVKFISELEYEDQLKFVPQMLFLLKDMNWPGAKEATQLMSNYKQKDLKIYIVEALQEANEDDDTVWIAWIKSFLQDIQMIEILKSYHDIIGKAEW